MLVQRWMPGQRGRGKFQQFQRSSREQRMSAEGIVFDSQDERARYLELRALQIAGHIRKLERQVKFWIEHPALGPLMIKSPGFPNGRRASYRCDFRYERRIDTAFGPAWELVHEERKSGPDDAASRLRRSLVEWCFPNVRITVTQRRRGGASHGKARASKMNR
jgi:hypothetical protein